MLFSLAIDQQQSYDFDIDTPVPAMDRCHFLGFSKLGKQSQWDLKFDNIILMSDDSNTTYSKYCGQATAAQNTCDLPRYPSGLSTEQAQKSMLRLIYCMDSGWQRVP